MAGRRRLQGRAARPLPPAAAAAARPPASQIPH